jgi:hypothetical protein
MRDAPRVLSVSRSQALSLQDRLRFQQCLQVLDQHLKMCETLPRSTGANAVTIGRSPSTDRGDQGDRVRPELLLLRVRAGWPRAGWPVSAVTIGRSPSTDRGDQGDRVRPELLLLRVRAGWPRAGWPVSEGVKCASEASIRGKIIGTSVLWGLRSYRKMGPIRFSAPSGGVRCPLRR